MLHLFIIKEFHIYTSRKHEATVAFIWGYISDKLIESKNLTHLHSHVSSVLVSTKSSGKFMSKCCTLCSPVSH